MQSVLQLMGEKEMYDYWSQTYRVHNLEWSQAKAADILDAWQKKFTEVKKIKQKKKTKKTTEAVRVAARGGGSSNRLHPAAVG